MTFYFYLLYLHTKSAMNLDIFCPLAPNSTPYAEYLYRNLNKLKSGKHALRFWGLISSLDNNTSDHPKGWLTIPVKTDSIHPIGISKPAVNHAKLLNQIEFRIPDDSDVTIITDCDMFIFPHNWDDFIYRSTREYDCIGTEKHDGSLRMFFIAFPTFVYKTLQPDWMPGKDDRYECGWEHRKSGTRIVADTGWKLEDLLIENEKIYYKFNLMDGTYYYYGQAFCAHLGGSHHKEFNSPEVKKWYQTCKQKVY